LHLNISVLCSVFRVVKGLFLLVPRLVGGYNFAQEIGMSSYHAVYVINSF